MKKRINLLLTICLTIILLTGCTFKLGSYTFNNLSVTKQKPYNFYYTNLLAKNLTLEKEYKTILVDMIFYNEKEVSSEDKDIIRSLIKTLKKDNFIEKPKDLPEKPAYKILLTFSKEKYVINVYNEKYLSIFPWDGDYPMDYIDMSGMYASYNLFSLSKYLIPR